MNIKRKKKIAIVIYIIFLVTSLLLALTVINSTPTSALSCNNCVNGGDIMNGTIKSADIANGTITASDLASGSVKASEIATGAVGASEIAINAVGNAELADDITVSSLVADTIFVTNLFNTEFLNLGNSVVTDIPDNGNGSTAASFTLDSTEAWAYLGLNCQDSNGCNVTLGEDFIDGDVMVVYNEGTNTINFTDTAGVSELAGNFAMGQFDTLELVFRDNEVTNSWLETSRSNN